MNEDEEASPLTYDSIEKFQKLCRTHRNSADLDKGYIAKVWKQSIELN